MDLVPAESLGYATADTPAAKALAIPATAPLLTGRRAIVYVELDSPEGPVFEGREVELGVRAGDYFVVKSGLAEGERVVTRGALAIDSALQIEARPSMMQAPATSPSPSPAPVTIQVDPADATAVRAAIKPAFDAYLQLTEALAADDADSAQKAAVALRGAVRSVKTDDLKPETAALLTTHLAAISKALPAEGPIAIERLRQVLPDLTAAVETCVRTFGHERAEPIREVFCPMAFDNRGARWLQAGPDVRNPYFGARMLNCGTVRAQIAADGREVR
jgi:Cu(I)/Ag(I) efflux system membrane fusion protein